MFFTMTIASMTHIGDGIMSASHAIESAIVFLSLIVIGAGKYSLDYHLFK